VSGAGSGLVRFGVVILVAFGVAALAAPWLGSPFPDRPLGVDDVYALEWAPGVPYREVRWRDEVEQSKYAFGQVDMPDGAFATFHREQFTRCYDFAKTLLDSGLVLPALDYCLKCSHVFNVLDASGSIGVTERTAYILQVRKLAVAIAKAWVEPVPARETTHGS